VETHEEFSENQKAILDKFVTNTDKNIFVLRNLPEVIKGALFSRYSRSYLGLRELLLKEFIENENTSFQEIVGKTDGTSLDEQVLAIQKAQKFYDRILDGFGDDSIGELGGAHLALEKVSILAAKVVEDCRIGGSPLEKSTRYIYFDKKINDKYQFYQEPVLMTSAFRSLYNDTCNLLFDTYSKLIPPLMEKVEKSIPREEHISKTAYTTALRAKVLDCLRGLLPASTFTNLGIFGNGRFFENLIRRLSTNNLAELQEIGKETFNELSKVIPSFIRRTDPSSKYQQGYTHFMDQMKTDIKLMSEIHASRVVGEKDIGVALIGYDPEVIPKVAGAILFENSKASLFGLQEYCRTLPEEEVARILDAAALARESRRHKSPRALEHATFTFEIVADFGVYRDLQRHRILTQEKQNLTCDYGYYLPNEIIDTEMEKQYIHAMESAKKAYDTIAEQLPEEAQYVVPMAYNLRWYFHVNLRTLQWLCELRSSPAGHPTYRLIAQEMAHQICEVFPQFERFFKFVDFEGYELGRMGQEIRRIEKLQKG